MKRKSTMFIPILALTSLVLSACGPNKNPNSLPGTSIGAESSPIGSLPHPSNSNTPSSSTGPIDPSAPPSSNHNPSTSVDPSGDGELVDGIWTYKDYDKYIDDYSQSGHLYIHYNRVGAKPADYDQYGLWLWPTGQAGGLFAAKDGPSTLHANTSGWMSSIGKNGSIDQAGACADIDLNSTSYLSGKEKEPFSLKDLERIGYLIVKLSTMGGSSHWTSDGGGDGFIEDVTINTRKNGAIHVFMTSGNARTPSYYWSEETYTNPVLTDTTGSYRSRRDINSSVTSYPSAPTSKIFSDNGKVGYQVFIPTFADSNNDGFGDLKGLTSRLNYLKELSVDTLWLSPFLKSNSYHGYDTVDYFTIDPRFGTTEDMQNLIKLAHELDIKLLMDMVINHSSSSSIWFKKAQRAEKGIDSSGKEFSYRDLFHFRYKTDEATAGKTVEEDPDWYKDGESNYYYYAKFSSDMPEFNFDAQITRDLMFDVAQYWLGYGIDGFRMDAIKHIYMQDESKKDINDVIIEDKGQKTYYDEQLGKEVTTTYDYSTNTTKNIAFWKEYSARIKALYPSCFLVAENFDGWDKRIAPYYQAFDSQFDFNEYYHNYEYLYKPGRTQTANDLAIENNIKFNTYFGQEREDFINSAFTSNHDVMRAMNFINGSGDVSGLAEEINKAKIHAAITMFLPGISFIYYGDELGMSSNVGENDLGHNNNEDRFYRQPMKWSEVSSRPTVTFGEGYQITYDSHNEALKDVAAQGLDKDSMLNFYKAITAIKGDKTFPSNGVYTGFTYDLNKEIYHFQMAPKSGAQSQTNYRFFINTGKNPTPWFLGANEEIVMQHNATSSTLNAYSVVVTRAKN